jgi:acyl dehydratase
VAVDPERDSALQYFEDISVGQKETAGPVELTKEEIMELSRRWDPQPFHVDEAAAQRSTFGGVTAAECHVFCVAAKLTHDLRRVALIAVSGRNFSFPNRAADQGGSGTDPLPATSEPSRIPS